MQYKAVIRIDDDRWAKHPYGIHIKDENDNEVFARNWLDSREECYQIAEQYGIDSSDIEEVFY